MITSSIERYAEERLEDNEVVYIEIEYLSRPKWWRARISGGKLDRKFGDGESAEAALKAVEELIHDWYF